MQAEPGSRGLDERVRSNEIVNQVNQSIAGASLTLARHGWRKASERGTISRRLRSIAKEQRGSRSQLCCAVS